MTQRSPVVLITGTSSGIGKAVAGAFAAKGFANAADPDSPIQSYAVLRGHVKEALIEAVRAGDDPSVVAWC
jgi:NAD(P)-dependent dehydrogenase (short-subunit alcohol dehydrogenase family)